MTALVTKLGPLGVFLLMVPESACIPVPSEVTLMCAGFGVKEGWMSFWAAVAAATAGNLVGSLIAYGVGRAGSDRNLGPRATAALTKCNRLYARHGTRAVFLARLMPLARTFVSLPAGYARMALGPFVVMTVLGCTIWAAAFALLGLVLGSGWAELSGTIDDLLLVASGLGLIAALYLRRARRPPDRLPCER
jgi:membrane protein DedA with SNARE-associated domain